MIEKPNVFFGEAPHIPLVDHAHRERAISRFHSPDENSNTSSNNDVGYTSTTSARSSPIPNLPIPKSTNPNVSTIKPPNLPVVPNKQPKPRKYSSGSVIRAPAPSTSTSISSNKDYNKLIEKLKKEISSLKVKKKLISLNTIKLK